MFDAHFSLGFETPSQPAMHIVGLAKCSASEGMLTPKQMMLKILIVRQKTMMVVPLLMQDLPSDERGGSLCFVEAEKLHASFGAIGSGWRLSVERFRCVELVSVDAATTGPSSCAGWQRIHLFGYQLDETSNLSWVWRRREFVEPCIVQGCKEM